MCTVDGPPKGQGIMDSFVKKSAIHAELDAWREAGASPAALNNAKALAAACPEHLESVQQLMQDALGLRACVDQEASGSKRQRNDDDPPDQASTPAIPMVC